MKHRIDVINQPFLIRWGRWTGHGQAPPPILGFHPVVEIQLVTEGKSHCLLGDRRHDCRRNTLLVIPPNTPHLFTWEQHVPGEKWLVNFRPSLLLQAAGQPWRLPPRAPRILYLSESEAEEIESVLRILMLEYERHAGCRTECVAAALRYLMSLIGWASRGRRVTPPQNPIVAGVIACIEEGYLGKLTLAALAAKAGYSQYYLAHLFKQCTGMSILQYILHRRVAEARRVLAEEPSMIVAAVGEQAGFGSYRVFCQSFRKFVRMSPAAYRRSCSERLAEKTRPD